MSSVDFSGFFGTQNTQSTSLSNMLGDYASIKNGSYGKLLKAYYKKQETDYASSDEAKAENAKFTRLKSYASDLKSAASAINDTSLFAKGDYDVTYADGSKGKSEYNMDKIYEKAKSFVDSYNSAIRSGSSTKDGSKLSDRTLSLVEFTAKNANLLSQIGITASSKEGEEGTLSIDEDKFKKASGATMKSLFTGSGSYASVVENKASIIGSMAESQMSKISSYDAKGSLSSGSSPLSSMFNSEV
ncbi:MAG: flagellar filament capping protein FliD [Lachnospiraceae bacterium]|nr:flagellar filament capping protein FliD [Lachnospiraceae bacterium]